MSHNDKIEHIGVISEIKDGIIKVDINVQSACASCHASGVCGVDSSNRIIEVFANQSQYNIGDQVKVVIKQRLGYVALLLGYVVPFFVIVLTLVIFLKLGISEGVSGLFSVLILIPYYITVYLFRDKIKKEFNFEIEKI
jgi:sigma-E factor negative regulatory protein RseC